MISEETRKKWKAKVETILKSVEAGNLELNEWETGYIDSIDEQLSKGKDLSFKQSQCLNKIFERC